MIHSFYRFFALFAILAALTGCDPGRVYEEHQAIREGIWNVRDKKEFRTEINDLATSYNVYLDIRNDRDYPYSNLFLFMDTEYPGGKISRDTVELTLADYDGRWLGSGTGSVKFSRFLFRKDVKFRERGKYRFLFEQAMRINELHGIRDIGIRIEKQK
ncbi:MAG TPA: gliding motility lipoprotein GldH [Bacteroidales bacterium]|nr:gliding motility lipoprotein GldH [Bacteroidales bacterium]HPS63921.1 gliding motility lipoprotein GldH [Bacteroidales bacterium]